MNKKRILFLTNNLAGGGAERVLVNLVNNMDQTKYTITLRTLIDKGENKAFLSDHINYQSVFKNGFRGINFLHKFPFAYKKVAYGDFDVVIVYLHGVLTKIVSKAPKGQKTIAYLHANMENSPFIKSFKSQQKLRNCFQTYNAIVSVSKSVEDSFKSVSGIEENLHVIYNTFNVEKIQNEAKELVNEISELNVPHICSVGKLTSVKGYDRLLKVLGRLKNEGFAFGCTLVGKGPERNLLENLIKELNLENEVRLAGYQSNPYKYISRADLFVSSSHSEGFSSVVAESIILGVPVLTTNTSGMTEILGENDEYGIITENSEEGLYMGIKNIMSNPVLLSYYRKKARERAAFFSPSKTVKDVEHLIDNLSL